MGEICVALEQVRSAGIICHVNPDADTLGSGLALAHAFHSRGIPAVIFCVSALHPRYHVLPGWETISQSSEVVLSAETLITVDCAALDRTGIEEKLEGRQLLNLDHHGSNPGFGTAAYIRHRASFSEILQELLEYMHWPITPAAATCLYAGIVTDSGQFSYPDTCPATLSAAARLMEMGADWQSVCHAMFHDNSLGRMLLQRSALSGMEFLMEGRLAAMVITLQQIAEAGAEPGDTENFVNIGIDTQGVLISFLVQEKEPGVCKVSLRGKGDVRVDTIAKHFQGGGHPLAAGCTLYGTPEAAKEMMIREIAQCL